MKPSRIIAVDHVCIEVPPGLEDALRWFYVDVCGLEEITSESMGEDSLRFRSEGLEIRVRALPNPWIEPMRRRLSIAVDSLNYSMTLLEERWVPFSKITGFTYTDRRIQTTDPAGHAIEIRQYWPEAPV